MIKYSAGFLMLVVWSFISLPSWASEGTTAAVGNAAASSLFALKLGHFLLGIIFVIGGLPHIFMFRAVVSTLEARGLPAAAPLLILGTTYQIIAGILLTFGLLLLPTALSLIVFTIVASVVVLDFWNKSGMDRVSAASGWLSNAGVIGGLVLVAAAAM